MSSFNFPILPSTSEPLHPKLKLPSQKQSKNEPQPPPYFHTKLQESLTNSTPQVDLYLRFGQKVGTLELVPWSSWVPMWQNLAHLRLQHSLTNGHRFWLPSTDRQQHIGCIHCEAPTAVVFGKRHHSGPDVVFLLEGKKDELTRGKINELTSLCQG